MSQSHLVPCPSCNRHVFTDACACPFCETALPGTSCGAPEPPAWRGRLSRTARFVAGASLLGAGACQSTPAPVDAGADSQVDASADGATDGAVGLDARLLEASPPRFDASEDRSIGPIYGAAPPRN